MATTYIRYIKQRKYVNGVATDEYRKGGVIDTTEWASQEACESGTVITPIYQWITAEGEYECVGFDKYSKEKRQVSNDNGVTWSDTGEVRTGSLIESNSADCGYNPIYQWVTAVGEYECVGFDKYSKEKEQMSLDGGNNWTDTGNTRTGSLIESNSIDCGYELIEWLDEEGVYICEEDSAELPDNGEWEFAFDLTSTSTPVIFSDLSGFEYYIGSDNNHLVIRRLANQGSYVIKFAPSQQYSNFVVAGGYLDMNGMSMNEMFKNCRSLKAVDASTWNASPANTREMFSNCENLKTANLSGWNTSNLVTCTKMFSGCDSLASIDFTGWDLSNATAYSNFLGYSPSGSIRCSASFRDWCISHADDIHLPTKFRDSSYTGWIIS